MLRRTLAVGLLGAALTSCGKSRPAPPPKGTGALITFIGDAPYCDILSFRSTIKGLDLILKGTGTPVVVFPLRNQLTDIKVNFAALRDFSTILHVDGVVEGTYDKAKVSFLLPQVVVFDPLESPPTMLLSTKFSTSTPTFNIDPPLTIVKGKVSGLQLDFDMRRSVVLDAQGQVSTVVTPVMTLRPVAAADTEGFGMLEDMVGFIRGVSTTSSDPKFTGGFSLQLLSGTGSVISANLTSATDLCGPETVSNQPCTTIPLNQIATGSFVELDGFVDTKGNLIATSAEVEDREIVEHNKVAFLGYVTSVMKDANGNATQFSLYVREEEPEVSFSQPLDSSVVVNLSSSTVYQFSSRTVNFANLPFDATAITPGQEVIVHGTFTKPPSTTPPPPTPPLTTVAADKVYLKLQAQQGNFSSLVQAGQDDKSGAFWLGTCASILQGAPILVITTSQTAFVNMSGLSALTPQPLLLVKGLPFFELHGTTINRVTVPPGTLVLLAKQVHQL